MLCRFVSTNITNIHFMEKIGDEEIMDGELRELLEELRRIILFGDGSGRPVTSSKELDIEIVNAIGKVLGYSEVKG